MSNIRTLLLSLLAVWMVLSPVSLAAAEQSCDMVPSRDYKGLLGQVPFLPKSKKLLESARSIKLDNDKLTMAGSTVKRKVDGKWKRYIKVDCVKNGNNWSPCGTPNAIFTLQKVSEKTVLATVNIAWEYGTMYKPIFKVEYSCSAVRTSRGSGTTTNKSVTTTNKTEQSRDYVGIAFKNYSVSKRKEIQLALEQAGFYKSSIDGIYGRGTRSAITRFASENGYSIVNRRSVDTAIKGLLDNNAVEIEKQIVVATSVSVTQPSVSVTQPELAEAETIGLVTSSKKWENPQTVMEAQRFIDEIQATIVMYMAIESVVKEQPRTLQDSILSVVQDEIRKLQNQKVISQKHLSKKFITPIKPSNANLQVSAFRASDTFPKVPFYIPGSNEIGETLVTPRVSDEGYLNYQFDFIDPLASYDKVRDTVSIAHDDIDPLITGMGKIDEWTNIAKENGVNRRISKTAACIPAEACDVKKPGISSTELLFQVYEDGSTSGRMQLNKRQFNVGYNMSVESTILLQAYLIYMRDIGSKEFNVGVMSDEAILEMFD